ncbi:hypothetical protein CC1G_02548 [Coprinopsis cinerea okayama7|uniref:RRM domain-containing protein n=1 Tax=Coprinopsis cinerea (strain Okayama-7 / 130 / ATCC MYA-4618 / FGSC 9003) TaxID=240176 RepID=A8NBT8_COPC7|nr:hypothetical protein CC1G_02548 [Coprinopsis cinerea okayama7\|eukprot:XP_001832286.2 hypothetical protein CC1G_02548 [Coprinopsis cinerea okayama7\
MAPTNTSPNASNRSSAGFPPSTTVQIKNIPNHIEVGEIISLFKSLIGEIRHFQESSSDCRTSLDISFYHRDLATKALCLNGYSIGGCSLEVTPLGSPPTRPRRSLDDRRNLYVLGLPFALTKTEFSNLFSRYGTVVHCVILATVDNSSRRRGFVVMSSHEEAKRALTGLTRAQIKGHTIDVSWAVVQRSQGFLDGGDRAMLLEPRPSHLSNVDYRDRHNYSSSGSDTSEYSSTPPGSNSGAIVNSPIPTTALLITNLPALLFSQAQDLHPLLCPFGRIERMHTVPIHGSETVSAVVQYASSESAIEARNTLNGQTYDTHRPVEVHFVHPSFGDNAGNLRLSAGTALDTRFDAFPSYTASRAPSPFFGSTGRDNHEDHFHREALRSTPAPYAQGYKERYEERHASSRSSRAGSPRNAFQPQQSRRVQGGFNPTF